MKRKPAPFPSRADDRPLRMHEVTELLLSWRQGDAAALDRLVPLVYDELRRVARRRLRGELRGTRFSRPHSFTRSTFDWSMSTA